MPNPADSRLRQAQDGLLDSIADGTLTPDTSRGTPRSLRPDADLMDAAGAGNRRARAIADSWAFRFPVTKMTAAQLNAIAERCATTFHGHAAEGR